MAENIYRNSEEEFKEGTYRNYSDFDLKSIYRYDDEGTAKAYSDNGWQDRTSEDSGLGTPLNADNLNAMLNMIIALKNMVGNPPENNQYKTGPDTYITVKPDSDTDPKKRSAGLTRVISDLLDTVSRLDSQGPSSINKLTHTYFTVEEALTNLSNIGIGEIVTIANDTDASAQMYVVGAYKVWIGPDDSDYSTIKVLIDTSITSPNEIFSDSEIKTIIEEAFKTEKPERFTELTAISTSPKIIEDIIANAPSDNNLIIIPTAKNIMNKEDIQLAFYNGPEAAMSDELIRKILNGEQVPDIDSEYDIPDNQVHGISEGNKVPETSSNIDITNSIIDKIVGGTY